MGVLMSAYDSREKFSFFATLSLSPFLDFLMRTLRLRENLPAFMLMSLLA